MKHLKKFEAQEIRRKDLSEMIDEVLDRLSKKGELSKSEKEFMKAASKDEVKGVTIPNLSGNFWADMANPHNVGILWQNDKGTWIKLIDIEEEEEEKYGDKENENGDDKYERKRKRDVKKYFNENPGLKKDLEEYLELLRIASKKGSEIKKKYKKPYSSDSHNFNQMLDYATSGKIESLLNQFGFYDYDEKNNVDTSGIL